MRALLLMALLVMAPADAGEAWPDIDEPVKTGARAPNDAAVVIGVERYPFLTDVPYATRDAEAFYDFLVYTRGVPSDRVQALYGASAEAIRESVREAAGEVGRGGVLWVYYAGHGGGDPDSGERLLVGDTAKPSDKEFAAGAIAVSEVRQLASGSGGEVVLVVDACYNGLGRDGGQYSDTRFAVPTYQMEQAARITEWTAAGPKELASPLSEVQHGAFTYFVLGALRGWADGELDGRRDGAVSPEEARLYVEKALRTVGRRDQHPQMVASAELALLSHGGEAAPDLRGLSAGGASAAQATSGELVSSGGFVVADLDVSAALAEKACAEDAEGKASSQRSSRVSSEVQSLAREASSGWSRLSPQAEACLGLDLAERTPCITAVKEYIRWADALEVSLSEGFEQVTTDCGARSVPMAAQRKSVSVSELEAARVVLVRLESASSTAAEPSGAASRYGYEMVQVPGGRFTMGQGGTDDNEKPAHSVSISGFWMGKTEVTQGLYQQVMGENPSYISSCGSNCPVECVSWLDAVTFANKLSELEGLEACYSISGSNVSWPKGLNCTGYRLPTEAEWEYAARAGQSTTYAGSNELGDVGWYRDNSGSKTHPVAQKQSNAWGLYDMSGNVWEWVWDWYDSSYYQSSTSIDPVGPSTGSFRGRRGGGFNDHASGARVAQRLLYGPDGRDVNLGLRLSRSKP
jgi:sulfatase modifying factor 1